MASGVYRTGTLPDAAEAEVLFHRDGKTATVDVVRKPGRVSITSNGKSDAALNMGAGAMSNDDPTMTLLGALPLAVS